MEGQIEGGERVGEVGAASMVGVLGIGGVGKTTAATVVAVEAGTMGFDGVVWLTAGVEQPSRGGDVVGLRVAARARVTQRRFNVLLLPVPWPVLRSRL